MILVHVDFGDALYIWTLGTPFTFTVLKLGELGDAL
jgi:hypothetical protein